MNVSINLNPCSIITYNNNNKKLPRTSSLNRRINHWNNDQTKIKIIEKYLVLGVEFNMKRENNQLLLFLDFLLVKVLTIQPCFLTLVPSTLDDDDATWQEDVDDPDLSLMTWKRWPIRLRHLSDDLGLLYSTMLVIGDCCVLHVEFVLLSTQTFDTVFLSHDAFPSFPNFIDIKESGTPKNKLNLNNY